MNEMEIDFEKELDIIYKGIEVPGYTVNTSTSKVALAGLHETHKRNGPESEHPLAYHNALHALDVCRRGVTMGNILYPYIQPKYLPQFFDIGIVAASNHDMFQNLGPGKNEKASADYAVELIDEFGDKKINTPEFKQRVSRAIIATTVEMKEDGELLQSNLQYGAHDPSKFQISFADINGNAMEGDSRMLKDATNLCYEIMDDPSIDDLYNFYINQATFMRQRLNDGRVKSDIAYYFPDHIQEVYQDMHRAFNAKILSAYRLAVLLGDRPELKTAIGLAVKTVDQPLIGDAILKILKAKLTD